MPFFSCCSFRKPLAPPIDTTDTAPDQTRRGSIQILTDDQTAEMSITRVEHERELQHQSRRQCGLFVTIFFLFVAVQQLMKGEASHTLLAPSPPKTNSDLKRCQARNLYLLAECENESRRSCLSTQPSSFVKVTALKCELGLKKCLQELSAAQKELQRAYNQGYRDHEVGKRSTNYSPKKHS